MTGRWFLQVCLHMHFTEQGLVSHVLSQLLPFDEIGNYSFTCWHTARLKVLNTV